MLSYLVGPEGDVLWHLLESSLSEWEASYPHEPVHEIVKQQAVMAQINLYKCAV